ncbi:MAG: hypothetical protein AAB663_03125 [Patescibacteria group bacterium]
MSVLSLLSRADRNNLGIDLTHPTVSLYFTRRADKPLTVLGEWWPSYRSNSDRPLCLESMRIREPFSSSTPPGKMFTLVSAKGEDVRLLCDGEPHPWFDVARIMAHDYKATQWPELLAQLMHNLPTTEQFTAAVTEAYDRHLRLLYHDRQLNFIKHGVVHGAAVCSGECRLHHCGDARRMPAQNPATMTFGCGITCDTPLAPIGYRIMSEASGSVLRKIARPHINTFVQQLVDDAAVITTALLKPHA